MIKHLKILIWILCCILGGIALESCNNNVGGAEASQTNIIKNMATTELNVSLRADSGSVADNSFNNSRRPSIVLYFNTPIDITTLSAGISLTASNNVPVKLSNFVYSDNLQAVAFSPLEPLDSQATYFIKVSKQLMARNGITLSQENVFNFTTGASLAPTAAFINPYDTNISLVPSLRLTFSESSMKYLTIYTYLRKGSVSGAEQAISISCADLRNCIISPKQKLLTNQVYYVYVTLGVKDSSGVALAQNYSFKFITGNGIVPSASMLTPANNESNVSITNSIQLQFSENINYIDNAIELRESSINGVEIPATYIINDRQQLIIQPTTSLPKNKTIHVLINKGITDDYGGTLAETSFKFTTSDLNIPTVLLVSPISGAIPIDSQFILQFSGDVNNVNSNVALYSKDAPTVALEVFIYKGSNNQYIIKPRKRLKYSSNYILRINNLITDSSGKSINNTEYNFLTLPDSEEPSATILALGNNDFLNPRTTHSIKLQFSEAITGLNLDSVKIYRDSCVNSKYPVAISSITDEATNRYNLSLESSIYLNHDYFICFNDTVVDSNKNTLSQKVLRFNTYPFINTESDHISMLDANSQANPDKVVNLVTDIDGNTYLVGQRSNSVSLPTYTYYLAKYNFNGVLLWQNEYVADKDLTYTISDMTLDQDGNIYLAGSTNKGRADRTRIYIAKYSSAGIKLWTYNTGPSNDDAYNDIADYWKLYIANAITLDKSGGYLYVVGSIANSCEYDLFGSMDYICSNIDGFIFKINTQTGVLSQNKRFYPDGDNFVYPRAVVAYDTTYFYVVGSTQDAINGGQQTTGKNNDYEGFAMKVKYSDIASISSITQFGTTAENDKSNVNVIDAVIRQFNGCTYLAIVGSTNYPLKGADSTYIYATNGGNTDAFVYQLNLTGVGCSNIISQFGSSSGSSIAYSVTALPNGAIYIAGTTKGSLPGVRKISELGREDAFIAVKDLDSSSQSQWNTSEWIQTGGGEYKTLTSISSNSSYDMFIAGVVSNTSNPHFYVSRTNLF